MCSFFLKILEITLVWMLSKWLRKVRSPLRCYSSNIPQINVHYLLLLGDFWGKTKQSLFACLHFLWFAIYFSTYFVIYLSQLSYNLCFSQLSYNLCLSQLSFNLVLANLSWYLLNHVSFHVMWNWNFLLWVLFY